MIMNTTMNQMGVVSNTNQIPNPNIYNRNIGQIGIGYNQSSTQLTLTNKINHESNFKFYILYI